MSMKRLVIGKIIPGDEEIIAGRNPLALARTGREYILLTYGDEIQQSIDEAMDTVDDRFPILGELAGPAMSIVEGMLLLACQVLQEDYKPE